MTTEFEKKKADLHKRIETLEMTLCRHVEQPGEGSCYTCFYCGRRGNMYGCMGADGFFNCREGRLYQLGDATSQLGALIRETIPIQKDGDPSKYDAVCNICDNEFVTPLLAECPVCHSNEISPIAVQSIAVVSVLKERADQDAQWGGPEHDDTHIRREWIDFIYKQLVHARQAVFEDYARTRFVKVAALALAAIESIDRKQRTGTSADKSTTGGTDVAPS